MARRKQEERREGSPEPRKMRQSRRRRNVFPLERKEWGYDPLLGLESIKTTMSGLLADLFTRRGGEDLPWEPPIDLYEDGENLIIEMTLPGAQKQDIQMHAYHNLLIVSGETRRAEDVADDKYHFHERRWGAFHRSIPLPYVISPENIKASLRDGVLKVTLPFEGKLPGKSVQVQIE